MTIFCITIWQYLCALSRPLDILEPKDLWGVQYLLPLNDMLKKRCNIVAFHAAWIGEMDVAGDILWIDKLGLIVLQSFVRGLFPPAL